jgi:hypothetical protein
MDSSKTPFDDPGFSGKSEHAAGEASSATGVFGTVSPKPAQREEDDLLKSLMRQSDAPAPAAVPPPEAPPPAVTKVTHATPEPSSPSSDSAGPGEFTQMLQGLSTPASAPRADPKQGTDLSRVFKQVSFEKTPTGEPVKSTPAAQPSGSSSPPGSFTQMFSALSSKTEEHAAVKPPPISAALYSSPLIAPETPKAADQPRVEAAGPDDFTKMFQALRPDKQPIAQPPTPTPTQATPALPPSVPTVQPPSGQSGTEGGSFTQMFSSQGVTGSPREDPLKSMTPESMPASGFQFSSSSRPPEPSGKGGFTQLLQALNQDAASVKPAELPLAQSPLTAPSPLPSAAPGAAAGGFTQLLKSLSAEPAASPQAPPPPVVPQAVAPPISSTGPGEFTRVISGSALRDLQSQGAPPAAPGAAPTARPVFTPASLPPAPHLPPAPPLPHAGAAVAPPTPNFAPPPFAFPPAPAPAPPAPAPPAEPGKLQKYLPLILVVNVFVLLVIVLILIFALHHK